MTKTFSFDYSEYPSDVWYDVRRAPFKFYGLYKPTENKRFFRIPESVAEATSEGVRGLNYNTAGGRITFATDSPRICVHAVMPEYHNMKHMPRTASAGFDVYADDGVTQTFCGVIMPPAVTNDGYFSSCNSFTDFGKVKNYVVNFPLYDSVDEVYIGVAPGAVVLPYDGAYTPDAPMIFYGSSITQGGCVSRPGLAYESYISRRFRRDFINLGFSGNGKAEDAIVDYMASLDTSLFVSDYDHNAPNAEYLEATHHKMYEKIRAAHPDVPYIMVSRPDFDPHPEDSIKRRDVIRRSYELAVAEGDANVYYIDGETLFGTESRDCCTVDGTHPNDLGHYRMARVIGDLIGEILKK
ncbi:MAG: SGNH/GDSL hydrolase family protein [Clostridia bacterium]|nr:SGNH/GDSL hydrolase family protein [Clostridia bacterium]